MSDNKLREKKLSFERMYNYGGKITIQDVLSNNSELSDFLIENYRKILKEYRGDHEEYYVAVQNKLMSVEDFVKYGK